MSYYIIDGKSQLRMKLSVRDEGRGASDELLCLG